MVPLAHPADALLLPSFPTLVLVLDCLVKPLLSLQASGLSCEASRSLSALSPPNLGSQHTSVMISIVDFMKARLRCSHVLDPRNPPYPPPPCRSLALAFRAFRARDTQSRLSVHVKIDDENCILYLLREVGMCPNRSRTATLPYPPLKVTSD